MGNLKNITTALFAFTASIICAISVAQTSFVPQKSAVSGPIEVLQNESSFIINSLNSFDKVQLTFINVLNKKIEINQTISSTDLPTSVTIPVELYGYRIQVAQKPFISISNNAVRPKSNTYIFSSSQLSAIEKYIRYFDFNDLVFDTSTILKSKNKSASAKWSEIAFDTRNIESESYRSAVVFTALQKGNYTIDAFNPKSQDNRSEVLAYGNTFNLNNKDVTVVELSDSDVDLICNIVISTVKTKLENLSNEINMLFAN